MSAKKFSKYTFLLLILFSQCLNALTLNEWQQQVIAVRQQADSQPKQAYVNIQKLMDEIPSNASVKDEIRALNVLTRIEVYLGETQAAKKHAEQAVARAKEHNDITGQIEAQLNISMNAINMADVDLAVNSTINNLAQIEQIDDLEVVTESILRMSMNYYRVGLVDESVALALQNMEIAKQSKSALALTYAYQGLAMVNEQGGEYTQAKDFYQKMREAASLAKSEVWEGHAMLGLVACAQKLEETTETVESLILQAIDLFETRGYPFSLASALYTYADFLRQLGQYDTAVFYLEKGRAIFHTYHNKIGEWYALSAYADLMRKLGQEDKYRNTVKQAYDLSVEIGFPTYQAKSAQTLARMMAGMGDFEQAYSYFAQATELHDQYEKASIGQRLVQLTERYKGSIKQHQIDNLNLEAEKQKAALRQEQIRHKFLSILLILGIFFMLVGLFLILKLRRSNKELIKLNQDVRASKNKLQATLVAIPDLLFVVDEHGVIIETHLPLNDKATMNEGACNGKHIAAVFSLESIDQVYETLHGVEGNKPAIVKQVQIPAIYEQRWFELSIAHKYIDQTSGKYVFLARDITERNQLEMSLVSKEQQFRTLAENSPDAIVRYDLQGKRTYVNPVLLRLMKVDESMLLGKTMEDWKFSADYEMYKTALENVMKTGKKDRLLQKIVLDSHRELYCDIHFVPEYNADGEVSSVLSVGRDVTELKLAEYKLEQAYEDLRQLAIRREDDLENERKRIARDMHDDLGQYLSSLRMSISVLKMHPDFSAEERNKRLQAILDLTDKTISVVRLIVSQLRPGQLEMGIMAALEWLIDEFETINRVSCELLSNSEEFIMDDNLSITIFRVVQESLTNIARYAKASQVKVVLNDERTHFVLKIQDDGQGFEQVTQKKQSFGILGMKERVSNLGGATEIKSQVGTGTSVEVRIPIKIKTELETME